MMRRLRPWLLPALLLAAAIALMFAIMRTLTMPAAAVMAGTPAAGADAPPGDGQPEPPEPRSLDEFAATIERPLFEQNRRPREATAAAGASAAADRPLILSGISISRRARIALIVRSDDPRTERLVVGGSIDGWRVEAITPKSVSLRRGTEPLVLSLSDRRGAAPAREDVPPAVGTAGQRAPLPIPPKPFQDRGEAVGGGDDSQ